MMQPIMKMRTELAGRMPYTVVRRTDLARLTKPHMGRRQMMMAIGAGALLEYLFDPRAGRSRRTQLVSRLGGTFRRGARRTERLRRRTGATAYGFKQRMSHLREMPKEYDDTTLQHKVQSEVLGRPAHKHSISVDVSNGIVTMRGTCPANEGRTIERAIRRTHGVRGVVNMLHDPGTPAPNKAEALRAGT